jgi:DNA repair exonuclease SbcCD ATPase subunit
MYVRRLARGPFYICRDVREARGTCDSQAIDAAAIEQATIEHLSDFRLDVEAWLRQRANEGRAERAQLERHSAGLRAEAAKLAARMERTREARDTALDAGEAAVAAQALIELARYEEQLADAETRQAEAEARVAEWTVSPDLGAQLERYASVNEAIGEQLAAADGTAAMNAVLKRLLGGAYLLRNERQGIVVYFELASDSNYCDWVKSEHCDRGTTGAQTFV